MSTPKNLPLGIALMILTTFVFSVQDATSRVLGEKYPVELIVMIRFLIMGAFVLTLSAMRRGGIRRAAKTQNIWLQLSRGALLICEIAIIMVGFVRLGLVGTHSIFVIYPLLIVALSGPMLGEQIGWRSWSAVGMGFVGVLIILRPGMTVVSPDVIFPFAAALMFALYNVITRKATQLDGPDTTFFYMGIGGALAGFILGIFHVEPIAMADWGWVALLCVTGTLSQFTLIRALDVADASSLQPFSYAQLVFVSIFGVMFFNDSFDLWTGVGAAVIVCSGLFALYRRRVKRADRH
ncbi:DMT family transporter [Paracoccaceae bacterium GXU_MW_L88]